MLERKTTCQTFDNNVENDGLVENEAYGIRKPSWIQAAVMPALPTTTAVNTNTVGSNESSGDDDAAERLRREEENVKPESFPKQRLRCDKQFA